MPQTILVPTVHLEEFTKSSAASARDGDRIVEIDDLDQVLAFVPGDRGCPLRRIHPVPSKTSAERHSPELIGRSDAIAALRRTIDCIAGSSSNVLITGETGTGKEVVAHLVHRKSAAASRPFIAVNCAAVPETLLESELFGHERGAFTGAQLAHPGWLEQAEGGTLFLDEIGDMPVNLQAKLLRVLESRTVTRLGGTRPIRADVRIIAATHQDPEALIGEKRFRSDLYFRLNVIRLELPPLRERTGDIPDLVAEQVRRLRTREGREVVGVDPDLLTALQSYSWPGNVRELFNLIESSLVLCESPHLSLEDIPLHFSRKLGLTMVRSDRLRMLDALRRTSWNKSEAAKLLGWSRMTLYRKMARLQVQRSSAPDLLHVSQGDDSEATAAGDDR